MGAFSRYSKIAPRINKNETHFYYTLMVTQWKHISVVLFFFNPIFAIETHLCRVTINIQWICVYVFIFVMHFTKWST